MKIYTIKTFQNIYQACVCNQGVICNKLRWRKIVYTI